MGSKDFTVRSFPYVTGWSKRDWQLQLSPETLCGLPCSLPMPCPQECTWWQRYVQGQQFHKAGSAGIVSVHCKHWEKLWRQTQRWEKLTLRGTSEEKCRLQKKRNHLVTKGGEVRNTRVCAGQPDGAAEALTWTIPALWVKEQTGWVGACLIQTCWSSLGLETPRLVPPSFTPWRRSFDWAEVTAWGNRSGRQVMRVDTELSVCCRSLLSVARTCLQA